MLLQSQSADKQKFDVIMRTAAGCTTAQPAARRAAHQALFNLRLLAVHCNGMRSTLRNHVCTTIHWKTANVLRLHCLYMGQCGYFISFKTSQ